MSLDAAVQEYQRRFNKPPEVISVAPGRINLIGEHTDYNEGFVFPAAIDKRVYVAAGAGEESLSNLFSREMGIGQRFDARTCEPGEVAGWSAYAGGMAWVFRAAGYGAMPNIQAVVSGDVPIGSGVSSSAALELAFGVLWSSMLDLDIPNREMALLAQRCENKFVGVNSGIMDQMASAMGRAGHAMFMDTRSLEIRYARVPASLLVVVCDTKKPRALLDSAYNERRSQCEEASRILGVQALRDADGKMLAGAQPLMDPTVFRRARHVITENDRCLAFADALEGSDMGRLGVLMKASHESLRDDYEVSCPELDRMAEAAWDAPGCVGARMTGAGFGGACVALVVEDEMDAFRESVLANYKSSTGRDGEIIACALSEGAHAIRPPAA